MEFSQLQKKKFVNITHIILAIIAIAGFATLLAIAPGLGILAKPLLKKKPRRDTLRKRLYELKHSGYIQRDSRGYRLTRKGKDRLWKYDMKTLVIQKKQRWDKRWRVVLFDIPERRRKDRDLFRKDLTSLGFYALQRSVFLHPYPCQKEVLLLCKKYRISRYICFCEIEQLPALYERDVRRNYFS